jgi:cysteine desulfurase
MNDPECTRIDLNRIYFDYAATTPLDPQALETMLPLLKEKWGNSTGLHAFGVEMKDALEAARRSFAKRLAVKESEIIFTASATESTNTILKGLCASYSQKGRHLITTQVEHASAEECFRYLEGRGFEITRLPVDGTGLVNPDDLSQALRSDTLFVSIIWVNNETGVIQPLKELAQICRSRGVWFHTDAAQGFGKLALHPASAGVDLITASSHKIYGPLGAALLYRHSEIKLEPLLHGGGQESGVRASTVNVPAIAGFSRAFEIYEQQRDEELRRVEELRRRLEDAVVNGIADARVNGHPQNRIPHIINLSFKNTDGELLAIQLDRKGAAVSTGSSCSSGKVRVSRVLQACGLRHEWLRGAIRISLGRFSTLDEIDQLIAILPETVREVRRIS